MGNTKPLDMGVDIGVLASWLAGYDHDNLTIGVVASHSSLQFLHEHQEDLRLHGVHQVKNQPLNISQIMIYNQLLKKNILLFKSCYFE